MPDMRPLSDDESIKALAAAIRGTGGPPLTREADVFLASLSAECLVERPWWTGAILTGRES